MTVDNFHVVSVPFTPSEADTPLVIDPNAVLSPSAAMKRFQPLAWRRHQVSQLRCAVQLPKLPARDMLDRLKPSARLPIMKSPGFRGAERLDHVFEYISSSV
jgi:hypothetical protein